MFLYLPMQWQERNLGRTQCYDFAYIHDGPVGDPEANLRLFDFLKEQNKGASHFMIGANIHDNPIGGRGDVESRLQAGRHRSTVK